MVTNYPQRLVARTIGQSPAAGTEGVVARLFARFLVIIQQFVCGLHGHDQVLHFEEHRVRLHCPSCGYDSPGWEVTGQGPRLRFQGDARRHLLMRPALARERKTA